VNRITPSRGASSYRTAPLDVITRSRRRADDAASPTFASSSARLPRKLDAIRLNALAAAPISSSLRTANGRS
jgi:hypothetical protein